MTTPPNGVHGAVDTVDRKILTLLMAEGRLPNNVLASRVGIAASTCLTRVRNLRQRGVIRGVHADVNLEALGRPLEAMVSISLQASSRSRIAQFREYLGSLPGVLDVYFLAGRNDFMVHVAVADPGTLRDFVVENLSAVPDVAMTETNLIFDHVRPTAEHVLDA
ncbi:Lrp/AsnC family transcriptional regulator [Nocardioides anomalus]|uniref:Lrp/AsnC family transcriptional regulator n=1 Tax=Nocardioides anomalus TaxID=2712223 RepID=A0A6G6WA00_9ACTN|nr:Lrp/AsnC family transcriptional regulator [Nocardioides anomalus]QIG42029.1 Lrp/AsnC family transcriptional regulator [Nocardioides anomalus]